MTQKELRQALSIPIDKVPPKLLEEVLAVFPEVLGPVIRKPDTENSVLYYKILKNLLQNTAVGYSVLEDYIRLKHSEKEIMEERDKTFSYVGPVEPEELDPDPVEEVAEMATGLSSAPRLCLCALCSTHMRLDERPFTAAEIQVRKDETVLFDVVVK